MGHPIVRKILCFLFFVSSSLFASKPPELSPSDVLKTLNQIMEFHVSHKKLSLNLIKRSLEYFLEELDPTKTYFLEEEIAQWLDPSEELLQSIKSSIEKKDFSVFYQMHAQMLSSIERRGRLEKILEEQPLLKNVSVQEFKDINWAKNEEELADRLLRIKSLQIQAVEKLDTAFQEKVLQRIAKRRTVREEEFTITDPVNQERLLLSNILKAFASSFDTHTAYFTPGEASQFMIQVQQRLFGIGAQLRDDLNGFTVVKLIEGGPASRNTELKMNDTIIAIDGEPVVGLEITDAVELIRGEEGTIIHLTVLRPLSEGTEKHEIKITRGEVVIKKARIESSITPFGEGVIAHVALHAFYQDPLYSSSADLHEEIKKIRKEHKIEGIILDLRQNSGGVLPQAVAVTGLFITKGIVVSIKDNNGTIEHLREIDGRTAYEGPLVILTSKASASAAEIVAQTLQDYGRAIVVGEHTYGKGTFQTFTLDASNNGRVNPKGEFKVTRGRYYTVSGKSPQLVGVKPDIMVPGFYSSIEIGEQHAKYPLENDSIPENFQDDLSDIPVIQRDQISWLYRFNLQQRLKTYTCFLPILKKNSENRIADDLLYQAFLNDLEKEELSSDRIGLYAQSDQQHKEAINIIKDLIFLLK